MAPEPTYRSHRHRSQSRPRHPEPQSPSCEPSQRRPRHGPSSPTRERTDPALRSRERHKQEMRLRSKSRTPGSARANCESRDKPSVKRPRVRFSLIELDGAAETLTTQGTCSGFLRKQADNEPGAWNQYYFVVKPLTYLFYYNSKGDETPRGIIDLEYLTDVKRNADCLQRAVGGGDNCFRVSGKLPQLSAEQIGAGGGPKMRPLYLDTEDNEKAKQWMNAIRNHRFSLKKDEQFFEMVHQLRDAKLQVSQLEETQQKESKTKWSLRIKAKTLLQKMRAVDSGNTDELPEVEIDLDDTADDMLAMLEGMEDVLVNLQMKLDQQKQEITQMKSDKAGTTSSRRGFTQVLQRAVSKRENAGFMEIPEDEEEGTLAAIKSRRQRKPVDQSPLVKEKPSEKLMENVKERPQEKSEEKPKEKIKEKPKEKIMEKPKEKIMEKPKEKNMEKPKEKIMEKPMEELPASLDNVSDVLAMWKAKKKKSPSPIKQPAAEDVGDDGSRQKSELRSVRGEVGALETGLARKHTAKQKSQNSERPSEEDTASINSTEDDSGERLPPGWTRHESRGYPGTYYYANEDGKVSWDVPTDDMAGSGRGKEDDSEDHHSDRDDHSDLDDDANDDYDRCIGHNDPHDQDDEANICPDTSVDTSTDYQSESETDEENAGGTTSAAYRKQKPKPKSAWAFKLPKLLPMTTTNTQAAALEAAASLSPIRHGANHHEF